MIAPAWKNSNFKLTFVVTLCCNNFVTFLHCQQIRVKLLAVFKSDGASSIMAADRRTLVSAEDSKCANSFPSQSSSRCTIKVDKFGNPHCSINI